MCVFVCADVCVCEKEREIGGGGEMNFLKKRKKRGVRLSGV